MPLWEAEWKAARQPPLAVISGSEYELEMQRLLYSFSIFSSEVSKHFISDDQAVQPWPLVSGTACGLSMF